MQNARILKAERLINSRNGNPRWCVTLVFVDNSQDIFTTSSDASCGYEVENFLRSQALLEVTLTKAGRIATLKKVR